MGSDEACLFFKSYDLILLRRGIPCSPFIWNKGLAVSQNVLEADPDYATADAMRLVRRAIGYLYSAEKILIGQGDRTGKNEQEFFDNFLLFILINIKKSIKYKNTCGV
ncbi:hypothetical protein SAMN05443144_101279 [Fodinibius roseus]|uniref:Uncharacterized protein n=1 Tax=Fodinibius roseus TaxID=1194090 RepID=A0A1M4TFA4_9BACT|nr:hypothetical protein [Fodinibius roseus]SHE43055.1 hypothetical protein SAMN05443144_101279 [Fodinibius roseus]